MDIVCAQVRLSQHSQFEQLDTRRDGYILARRTTFCGAFRSAVLGHVGSVKELSLFVQNISIFSNMGPLCCRVWRARVGLHSDLLRLSRLGHVGAPCYFTCSCQPPQLPPQSRPSLCDSHFERFLSRLVLAMDRDFLFRVDQFDHRRVLILRTRLFGFPRVKRHPVSGYGHVSCGLGALDPGQEGS